MRPLDASRDADALDALWRRTLGDVWPLSPGKLAGVASGGQVIDGGDGLDAAALTSDSALVALVVAPERRGQGMGRALVDAIQPTSIGAGGAAYLWPGVPTNLPGAIEFFRSLGWDDDYICWDYAATLPCDPEVVARPTPGVRYLPAPDGLLDAIVEFNERRLPEYNWARYYRSAASEGAYVALDEGDNVVGSLLLEWSGRGDPGPWQRLLGAGYGALGAVGVAPTMHNRGIGTNLVLHGTRYLESHGATACHVGWLVRTDFYQRCGFSPWRSYQIVTK